MGIDGAWRRRCTMADISENGASLTVDETLADLNLNEFFLVLSSNGAVYRRCALEWINGSDIGAKFATQMFGRKEKTHPYFGAERSKEKTAGVNHQFHRSSGCTQT